MAKPKAELVKVMDYERDFVAWSEVQAALLRARRIDGLDWDNLAEEIESMGRSDRRALESRLRVILLHLMKWQVQPGLRGPGWRRTLDEQRREVAKLLHESPSLRPRIPSLMGEAYVDAVRDAVAETGLRAETFASTCPFAPDQVLDDGYLPAEE